MVISHFILFQPHLDIQLYNYEVSLRETSLKYSEEEKMHQEKASYDFLES